MYTRKLVRLIIFAGTNFREFRDFIALQTFKGKLIREN